MSLGYTWPVEISDEAGDREIDFLETQVPRLAAAAFEIAFVKAISLGHSVMISKNDAVYELFPDGSERFVEPLPPRTPVKPGTKISLK
jgi:hypothetical protein